MKDSSKIKIKIHPKEGLLMQATSSPWLRFCAGFAILIVAIGVAACICTPCLNGIAHLIEAVRHT